METKKLAVLTSGGDSQGMNCALAILTRLCSSRGIPLFGIYEGYKGLSEGRFTRLTLDKTKNIEALGGTILKTSRFLEFKDDKVVKKCAENLAKAEIDVLIVIGGDGSFAGAKALVKHGVNVLCIPATVDNDLRYTDRCIGFDSAVNYASSYIENVKQTMTALSRGVVFEVMGRYCGDIALHCACATACDIVAVPEKKISEEELISQARLIRNVKHRMPTIVIAEKLFDIQSLSEKLSTTLGGEVKYSIVGYLQRGGAPSVQDRTLAMLFSVKVMELVEHNIYGQAVGIKGNTIIYMPIEDALNSEYHFNYDLLNLFHTLNQ